MSVEKHWGEDGLLFNEELVRLGVSNDTPKHTEAVVIRTGVRLEVVIVNKAVGPVGLLFCA